MIQDYAPTHTGISRFSFPNMRHDGRSVAVKIGDWVSLAQSAFAKDVFYVVRHGPSGWTPLTYGGSHFKDLIALEYVFDDLREVPAPAATAPDRTKKPDMTQLATDIALLTAAAQRDADDRELFALAVCGICSHQNVLFADWPDEKLAELSARINDSITIYTRLGTLEAAVLNALQRTLA